MTIGLVVFLVGLFGVPLALLWYGHKLRRRSARERRMFWGALIGHCVAGTLALVFSMIPPEAWSSQDMIRGFFGFWALLAGPVLGAGAALLTARES